MSKLVQMLDDIKELNFSELRTLIEGCEHRINEAKKSDFFKIYMSSDRTIYVNLGKGQGTKWVEHKMKGIEDKGVVVEKVNPSENDKKRTVRWDMVTTKEELVRTGVLNKGE